MTLEELRKAIEEKTGVPVSLLRGETAEEVVARAKAVLAYKREHEAQRPKTAQEQFADWFGAQLEDMDRRTAELLGRHYEAPQADPAGAALAEVAEAYRVEAGGYPQVTDGGNPYINGKQAQDGRSTADQFAEWFNGRTAFNPVRDEYGWKKIS